MNKLRFHLGAGKHFMHWQVKTSEGTTYYDPDKYQLRMTGCELKNNRKKAEVIYTGANKAVCAWVQFRTIEVVYNAEVGQQIRFNPRTRPYWHINWTDRCIDNMILAELITSGRSVCLPA